MDEDEVSVEFGFVALRDTKRDALALLIASTHSSRSSSLSTMKKKIRINKT